MTHTLITFMNWNYWIMKHFFFMFLVYEIKIASLLDYPNKVIAYFSITYKFQA